MSGLTGIICRVGGWASCKNFAEKQVQQGFTQFTPSFGIMKSRPTLPGSSVFGSYICVRKNKKSKQS
jgi:hypothetical protein